MSHFHNNHPEAAPEEIVQLLVSLPGMTERIECMCCERSFEARLRPGTHKGSKWYRMCPSCLSDLL